MAILVDYSAVAISSVMISISQRIEMEENYIRHIILNVIRSARKKYHKKYGEVVICVDSHNYWRKDIFPYYKASRKKTRQESGIDWSELYRIIDLLKQELKENFPYKVIEVPRTEADDLIATICIREAGPHMIISNDKDFNQLHRIPGVGTYSPKASSEIKCENPDTFLVEHIITGDIGDGIPNILSDDDTMINTNKRQRPIREAKLREWLLSVPENIFDDNVMDNYRRNEKLISLFHIPEEISESIWQSYIETERQGSRGMKLMKYFMDKGLRNLLDEINEF